MDRRPTDPRREPNRLSARFSALPKPFCKSADTGIVASTMVRVCQKPSRSVQDESVRRGEGVPRLVRSPSAEAEPVRILADPVPGVRDHEDARAFRGAAERVFASRVSGPPAVVLAALNKPSTRQRAQRW